MLTKIQTFLLKNDLDLNTFLWAQSGLEYVKKDEAIEILDHNFLGKIKLFGDGVILSILADTEPHTGDYIIEMQLEDFKHGNHTWSRL